MLAEWVAHHVTVCRPHDLTALFLTLATVYHTPCNADRLFHVSSKDIIHCLFLIVRHWLSNM
jgi:hypothetical protein